MTKEIRLNAFDMNCVGHIQHGMWTHPRDRSTEYNTIEYWQGLARLAERGKFDGIFLADIVGVYDVYRGGPAPSIVDAVQIPVNDPMMVVPVMAAVTEHIGFGVTANLTYEPPYCLPAACSTLDHLTGGRVGWNIVDHYRIRPGSYTPPHLFATASRRNSFGDPRHEIKFARLFAGGRWIRTTSSAPRLKRRLVR